MASPVSSAPHVQTQLAANATTARQPVQKANAQPAVAKSQPPAADTVQISAAARALQETTETAAQTVREASSGDLQAQRLLAKQAAARVVEK